MEETKLAVLQVEAISRSFGSFTAISDLSLEAYSGEIIGLLGPNGAGKTTAIRVLTTVLSPTRGRFSLCSYSHTKPVEIRRRIGVLPESSGYPLGWTGAEFLRYYARLYGCSAPRAREVATSLLSEVDLMGRASSSIRTYSRGMRQRLGVARALLNDPKVLFLDEPTLGLDPAGQRRMLGLIRDIAVRRGATIILSTHFLDEVEEVCSRALILNHGRMIAEGSIDDIKRKAAPKRCRFRVPPEIHDDALAALIKARGVTAAGVVNGEQGWLSATFDPEWLSRYPKDGMNSAIQALIDAQIPVTSFDLEGGRLSEAFLVLIEGGGER